MKIKSEFWEIVKLEFLFLISLDSIEINDSFLLINLIYKLGGYFFCIIKLSFLKFISLGCLFLGLNKKYIIIIIPVMTKKEIVDNIAIKNEFSHFLFILVIFTFSLYIIGVFFIFTDKISVSFCVFSFLFFILRFFFDLILIL